MMRVPALERILSTERVRRRATAQGDFAVPALQETVVQEEDGPFLVTTTRSGFVQTRRRIDGTVWAGFQECPIGNEGSLLKRLYADLWDVSAKSSWPNRCTSLSKAQQCLTQAGFEVASLVIPPDLILEACGESIPVEEAERLMAAQGYLTKVGDMQVLVADLEPGTALLTSGMALTGIFARSDDYVSVTMFRVDQAWALVQT